MNTFDKIKERLEEETYDMEICEEQFDANSPYFIDVPYKMVKLEDALSIVSEVEAEFATDTNVGSNGWIPCSERLPEGFQSVLCYAESIARSPDTIFVGSQKHGFWFLQSSIGTESFPTQYKVIAWMPLPELYKPEKGAQDGR